MIERHLSEDRLVLLLDEEGTADERAHLAVCEQCRNQLEVYVRLGRMIVQLPDLSAPAHLRSQVLERVQSRQVRRASLPKRSMILLQAAAALLIFAAGVATAPLFRQGPDVASPSGSVQSSEAWLTTTAGDPAARLALLDAVLLTAKAARQRAPADPGIRTIHERVLAEQQRAVSALLATYGTVRWF